MKRPAALHASVLSTDCTVGTTVRRYGAAPLLYRGPNEHPGGVLRPEPGDPEAGPRERRGERAYLRTRTVGRPIL